MGAIGFVRPWLHVRTRCPFLHDWHAYVFPSKNCLGTTSDFLSARLGFFSSIAQGVVCLVRDIVKSAQSEGRCRLCPRKWADCIRKSRWGSYYEKGGQLVNQ